MPDREPTDNSPKRPGGPLRQKPISVGGVDYDPFHPPKIFQNTDGTEEIIGGRKFDKDEEYADRFWARRAKGSREVMVEYVHKAAQKDGFISSFVDPSGITEKDREKLSAYRKLARELGYEVGDFKFSPDAYTAIAPIKKVE